MPVLSQASLLLKWYVTDSITDKVAGALYACFLCTFSLCTLSPLVFGFFSALFIMSTCRNYDFFAVLCKPVEQL